MSKLERELLDKKAELEAAEAAEMNLVEAFCVPILTGSLNPPSPPPTPPSGSPVSSPMANGVNANGVNAHPTPPTSRSADPPAMAPPSSPPATPTPLHAMPTFCRYLLEARDPFDGRNLLLLACGAGSTLLVDLLLTHAERSRGSLIDSHARSRLGETALHLAAASGHFDICKMLLQRTYTHAPCMHFCMMLLQRTYAHAPCMHFCMHA